jgi:dUTP pyrophosphatase
MECVKFLKIDDKAVTPTRGTPGSAGIDITVTYLKKFENGVYYCGTGLSVRVPKGCYSLLYPRSSISKNGFMLANSVGLIDNDYQGELIVALRQLGDSNDIQFPLKAVQLVVVNDPRATEYSIEMVDTAEYLEETTSRGTGGFGSTDSRL